MYVLRRHESGMIETDDGVVGSEGSSRNQIGVEESEPFVKIFGGIVVELDLFRVLV